MQKDLVIIGSYPKKEEVSNILYDSILSLRESFDICLCTHYPAKQEIQKLVNYYIYDYRNELIKNDTVYFWADYPTFYFESYSDDTSARDYSFAILRLIMNAVNLLKNNYDSFYYIEGDGIFSKEDVEKIKNIKKYVDIKNKKAWFFKFNDFLSTIIFYSKTDFFVKNIPFCNTSDEYNNNAMKVSSYGILENYIYKNLEYNNVLNEVLTETNFSIIDFFPNSKLSLNSFNQGKQVVSTHVIRVLRIKDESNFAFVYVNENRSTTNQFIYMDGDFLCEIPYDVNSFVIKIHPKNNLFTISDGINVYEYDTQNLLKSKSFIILK